MPSSQNYRHFGMSEHSRLKSVGNQSKIYRKLLQFETPRHLTHNFNGVVCLIKYSSFSSQASFTSGYYVLHDWQNTYSRDTNVAAFPAKSVSDIMLKTMGILKVTRTRKQNCQIFLCCWLPLLEWSQLAWCSDG